LPVMRVLFSTLAMASAMEDSLLDETVLIQTKIDQTKVAAQKSEDRSKSGFFYHFANNPHLREHVAHYLMNANPSFGLSQKSEDRSKSGFFYHFANNPHLREHVANYLMNANPSFGFTEKPKKAAKVSPQVLRSKKMKIQALAAKKKQDPDYMLPMDTTGDYAFDMSECAPGCPSAWIGDGICDYACDMSEECMHDLGDCDEPLWEPPYEEYESLNECEPGCPAYWMGDGICDPHCLTDACSFDGGDCEGGDTTNFDMPEECAPGCPTVWIGDGICDHACAESPECEHDLGDCDFKLDEYNFEGPDGTEIDEEEFEEEIPEWIHEAASDLWPGAPMDDLVAEFEQMPPAEQEAIYQTLMSHPAAPEEFPNPADFVHHEEEEFKHHQEHYYEAEVAKHDEYMPYDMP